MGSIVYKVVRRCGDNLLHSCSVDGTPIEVVYHPGRRVWSPHGPVLAFDTVEHAREFMLEEREELWEAEAEVEGSVETLIFTDGIGASSLPRIVSQFWKSGAYQNPNLHRTSAMYFLPPPGTLACRWIELKRRVV